MGHAPDHILKLGLHMVVTIMEHACDGAAKGILKLSTYQLQIDLVKINTYDHYNDVENKP